ncbi:large conductance mechanosensitive channel protein MscL [Absiella sp. AM29-15]|uniref:large conductance mechanosensitive channel protein MscL n=1 Tax=Absiella sp. AM29-15 TaxID=2292278 RepID=UPI000E41E4A8|nr:large conductance mechanosensitive channel protein MscL [Absiella sp. AM29-15]RGC53183.1 large conductance mechanosensitive channel protein MscL [Absiella sp. AM29-15]
MKNIINEFKEFIMRGNVLDMAVGVIIGGAFQKIIGSLVNDVIMPVISLVTGGVDFSNWFIALDGHHYASLAEAQTAKAATLNYGTFITQVINFLIMAFVIFMMVKIMNTLANKVKKPVEEVVEPETKVCPYCMSEIDIHATRCPHCTSKLSES